MKYNCNCPGHPCGLFVNYSGKYAEKCEHRRNMEYDCNATGKVKAKEKKCRCQGIDCDRKGGFEGNYAAKCPYLIWKNIDWDVTRKAREKSRKDAARKLENQQPDQQRVPAGKPELVSDLDRATAIKLGVLEFKETVSKVRKEVGMDSRLTSSVFF